MLREYRESDLDSMTRWVNDPEVTQHLSPIFDRVQTVEMTRSFLRKVLENEMPGHFFVIARPEDQRYLGQLDLHTTNDPSHQASLSVIIPDRDDRGKGHGREAMELGLDFGFRRINLNRIWLYVFADNAPAIHLYQSLGFQQEGVLREDVYRDGRYLDVMIMGLLQREWEARAR